jgi:hypothetical protein
MSYDMILIIYIIAENNIKTRAEFGFFYFLGCIAPVPETNALAP